MSLLDNNCNGSRDPALHDLVQYLFCQVYTPGEGECRIRVVADLCRKQISPKTEVKLLIIFEPFAWVLDPMINGLRAGRNERC